MLGLCVNPVLTVLINFIIKDMAFTADTTNSGCILKNGVSYQLHKSQDLSFVGHIDYHPRTIIILYPTILYFGGGQRPHTMYAEFAVTDDSTLLYVHHV